jgi:predicted alpha/beta-fold hydrolase
VRAATFREFDDAFTAPLHGFRDADDYYAQSSSGPWLARIAVPTCVVHALDDPFLPAAAIPLAALRDSPSIEAHISDHGGHVGFLAGAPWSPRLFAEPTIAEFLAARLARPTPP